MELVGRAVQRVAAGFYDRVDYGAGATAKFRTVGISLDLELLERVDGGLHDLCVTAAEGVGVRSVIDAVEEEGILEGAVAVHVKSAFEADGLQAGRGGQHAGRQLREQIIVASVKRQLDNFAAVDDGSTARRLRLQNGGFFRHP